MIRLIRGYWRDAIMVCRAMGNYGTPFKAGRGVTQGGPLSAKLFLAREAERDRLLAEEAKEQLTKKSAEADRARMARAEKDWRKLQERKKIFNTYKRKIICNLL